MRGDGLRIKHIGRVAVYQFLNDAANHSGLEHSSITVEGIELGSDCRALVSKHKDGTGTITLVFDGKII